MAGYTWIDDEVEHSDADEARADAIARKLSALRSAREERGWARQADYEDGRGYDPEPDECETCGGSGYMGESEDAHCTNHNCKDGYDMSSIREYQKRQAAARADEDLEEEMLEEKLAAIGARMMRPYEHWNEDERYMEYMETRYDNAY